MWRKLPESVKLALMYVLPVVATAGIVLAPHIGLGSDEQFVLYRWLGLSRGECLAFILAVAGLALFSQVTSAIASLLQLAEPTPIARERGNTGPRYRPEIDGLRAVAVSAVIINHVGDAYLPSGFLGVDVFFVISGYVILASMLADRRGQSLANFLLGFYARRVRRLLPALVVFIVVSAVATCLVSPGPGTSLSTGLAALFGVSNIQLYWQAADYFAPSAQYNTFAHTWSLGAEEQFYLIAPLLVYFTAFRRPGNAGYSALLLGLCALAIFSLGYRWHLEQTDPTGAFFLMPARFWEIAVGAIVYLLVLRFGSPGAFRFAPLAAVPLMVMIGTFLAPSRYAGLTTILAVVATGLLIATLSPTSPIYRGLTTRPILYIGKISYSLYLWHWGVISVSRWLGVDSGWATPLLILVMLGLAAGSYHFVELPLRHAAWGRLNWQTLVIGVQAASAAAIVLLIFFAPLRAPLQRVAEAINPLQFQPQPNFLRSLPCHLPKGVDPIGECLKAREPSKRSIYVIGDSHASNHVPSLAIAATHFDDVEVRYLVEWGFVLSLTGVDRCSDHANRPCLDNGFAKQIEFFSQNLRSRDIVMFSWARDRIVHEGPIPRQPNTAAIQVLTRKLLEIRSVVLSKGAQFVLVDDIPKPCNNAVNWQVIYATGRHELCSTTIGQSKEDRRPLSTLYASMIATGVHIIDPHDALCGEVCSIYDPRSRSLIYAENSPHFPPSRPAPLSELWTESLRVLVSTSPTQ